jgi:pimeloyl-ACP methyl ester carboxylesterase
MVIRYVEAGQGPPVVLIHGYIANADRHWVQTGAFANLAADHRVDCARFGCENTRRFPGTGNLLRRQAYLADVELATLKLNSGS